jgi:hypothetical protein
MIGIGPVHRGVERAGIADQRHERGSYVSSPALKGAITRARASCGGSVVLMEEAAEFVAAPYLADGRS